MGFGKFLKKIGNAIKKAFKKIIDTIKSVFQSILNVFKDVLGAVFELLGISDEDIEEANVVAVKIYQENLLESTRIKQTLQYQQKDLGGLAYAKGYANIGHNQFFKYYNKGIYDYVDHLPTTLLAVITIKSDLVKNILQAKHGVDISIENVSCTLPDDDDWCYWWLQEHLDYHAGEDYVNINGTYYKYAGNVFNESSNTFTITLTTITSILVTNYRRTTVSVTSRDTVNNRETRSTLVETYYTYVNPDTGARMFISTSVIESNTTVDVPLNSTLEEVVIETIGTSTLTIPASNRTYTATGFTENRHYIVEYYLTGDVNRKYYWIYDLSTEVYPELTAGNYGDELDAYPVAMLRNNKYNIDRYDASGRPATITKKRYEDTVELLSAVGLSVDEILDSINESEDLNDLLDAFFILGINPVNTEEIVSKYLYEFIDNTYDDFPPLMGNENKYAFAFSEKPFNIALVWKGNPPVIRDEHIGMLGTCTHRKSGKNLIVKKQITNTTTKEYTLRDIQGVTLVGQSIGKSIGVLFELGGDKEENFIIPLLVDVVDNLTLMEKTALLGESAYLLFYAYKKIHLRWYQTAAFGKFLQIFSIGLTIAVTIFTGGSGAGIMGIVTSLAKGLAIGVGLQLALHLIDKLVPNIGLKIALSVIATIGAMYIGGAFEDMGWLTAAKLCEIPSMVANMFTADRMSQLTGDYNKFQNQYQERIESNEAIMKSFNSPVDASFLSWLGMSSSYDTDMQYNEGFIPFRKPEDFFNMVFNMHNDPDLLYINPIDRFFAFTFD